MMDESSYGNERFNSKPITPSKSICSIDMNTDMRSSC
jgi:hypothetical protein